MVTNKTVSGEFVKKDRKQRPEEHDTTIEVYNIISFVLYTKILKQSVLKPASPGITLITIFSHFNPQKLDTPYYTLRAYCLFTF